MFFRPNLVEKEEDKKGQFSSALQPFLFTVDVTNMRCLKSTYLSYSGEFFEQQEGAAMGSSVSVAVANLYVEIFKELALRTATTKPCLWKRYIDDTCCLVKKGTVEELVTHLNNVRLSIKCRCRERRESPLP